MEDRAVFDQLVRELANEERRALLVRIQSTAPVYEQSLQPEDSPESIFEPEQELASLNLLERILLLVRSLLSRKDKVTLLVERYLNRLAADIERDHPSLISVTSDRCLAGLHEEILLLRARARSLHVPLHEVLGQHRSEFIAFLARSELGMFRQSLERETDPEAIWEHGRFNEEKEVRVLMLERFRGLIDTITPAERQRIGAEARTFFALYRFARYPFEELLLAFHGEDSPEADYADIRKPLQRLAECLEPLRTPPSAQSLYDLFLFLHQEQIGARGFDLERRLMDDMAAAHSALAGIRRFRNRVPLHSLLRLINRNPGFYPAPRRLADDWFTHLKDFWRRWVHHRYLEFYHSRIRGTLVSEALEFLKRKTLAGLTNYRADKFGPDTPVRHELSLSFIQGFFQDVFSPLSRALKLLYLNGEFYKEENRSAYTDAFLYLSEAETKIGEFETVLGPQGELRKAIQQVKTQALGQGLRQKRIADILVRADSQARTLVDGFLERIEDLKALLYGVLKGQPGDRYDTLVNLAKIGGRENSELRESWNRALEKSDQAGRLLKRIRELEINS